MAERQFDAGIEARLCDKDLDIVLELAADSGRGQPAARIVRSHLDPSMAKGQGTKDLSPIIEVVEQEAGRQRVAP
jgi:3-hydroxyisobutyrate dehydrogenase-like beta-hydroxyacid dehydrogenase